MREPTAPHIRLLKNDKAHTHRDKDKTDLVVSSDIPVAPAKLSERAQKIFNEFVERIDELGLASEADIDIITLYATNEDQYLHLESILKAEGLTYTSQNRNNEHCIKPRPEVAMLEKCKNLKLKILAEFGLTPAARKRVAIKQKTKGETTNKFARTA